MNRIQLIRIFLFCLILFAFLWCIDKFIAYGASRSPYSYYHKIALIGAHKTDPEVAVFGSSVGEVAVNASQLSAQTNRTAYNLCIDGTRFLQYNGLIREFNQYSTHCKLVVMAETFFSLSKIDQLTEPDRYLAFIDKPNIYQSLHDIQPDLTWKLKCVPFYRFVVAENQYYKASFLGLKHILTKALENDSLLGFTPRYKEWETGLDKFNSTSKRMDITVDSATVSEYMQTLIALRKKGKKVLLIIPPIQEDGLKLLGMNELRKTLSSMEGEGIYFRDYSSIDLSRNKKYFYNNSHLNAKGARAFTGRLALTIDSILINKTN